MNNFDKGAFLEIAWGKGGHLSLKSLTTTGQICLLYHFDFFPLNFDWSCNLDSCFVNIYKWMVHLVLYFDPVRISLWCLILCAKFFIKIRISFISIQGLWIETVYSLRALWRQVVSSTDWIVISKRSRSVCRSEPSSILSKWKNTCVRTMGTLAVSWISWLLLPR